MITRPADTRLLRMLAAVILEQYSEKQIAEIAKPMTRDFLAVMRVHPSPNDVAKAAAIVMNTRFNGISHEAQQYLFTLAGQCTDDALHVQESLQSLGGNWVTFNEKQFVKNYAVLLITLANKLEPQFFLDQLASMVFCASDPIDITFTIAKLVYQHLPPMQRFSPETIKILTEGTVSTDSLNIQGTFSAQILEAIENTYRMIILVNKNPSNGDPQPTIFMRKHLES